jgi:hypothetical protein
MSGIGHGLPGYLDWPPTPSMTGPWLIAVACFAGLVAVVSILFMLGFFS